MGYVRGLRDPGPFGPSSLKMIHRIIFRALRALLDLSGRWGKRGNQPCFRQLMEGAGCKERFGNTPENDIRPDLSKLNLGGSRFQAMALRAILTATPSFRKRGLHLSFGNVALKSDTAVPAADNTVVTEATTATKLDKQPAEVWAGPRSGPEIAKQSEKAWRRQMELAPI